MTFAVPFRDTFWSVPFWTAFGVAILAGASGVSHAAEAPTGAEVLQQLRSFANMGSVLYVAAHPDDENTQAIAYLARGRGYRTAYLSLTRGDGGQNLLGPQLGEALGVARTQELLAARRLDGGRQYFTRAKDFGYSKSSEETLGVWDRQGVLGDIVRVIREFRPDVIITRFSPKPARTHGHHTASAVLAVEAFALAADPAAFPEQLRELRPWQARRIVHNVGLGAAAASPGGDIAVAGSPANVPDGPGVVKVEVGGRDPVSGESFASIAARSRGMHKTQGFGIGGPPVNEGSRIEPFVLLADDAATNDLLDGVDTTWHRVPGGADIARSIADALAKFNAQDAAACVPTLLAIRRRLAALPADPIVSEKREQLDRIIQACLGLEVDTVVDRAEVVPGETLKLRHTAVVRSRIPVRWTAVRYPTAHRAIDKAVELRPNQPAVRETSQVVPASTAPSQPYWLRTEGTAGLFDVDDPSLIGRAENPPTFPLEYVFDVGGQTLVIAGEPMPAAEPAKPALRRRLTVIAPVSLRFTAGVRLFAPGAARQVTVELTAARASRRHRAPRRADLTPERLRGLDAVVIGIRAFNVRTDLAERLPALFAYVEAGGTVVAQYNTLDGLREGWLAPFHLRLSRDRVTDEHAPVTILAPEHPVLTTPNRITAADFEGWAQERGLYFPDQWDERFTAILASGDAGETPLKSGLLAARHGKGYFVYTSLAWFRQLPDAVPGAYRLFANLVSLGK